MSPPKKLDSKSFAARPTTKPPTPPKARSPEILNPNSLFDMNNFESAKPDVEYAFSKLNEFTIPNGFKSFNKMFNEVFDA